MCLSKDTLDVYLWSAGVDVLVNDVLVNQLAAYESWLTDSERARAGTFRFDRDRHRFIAARGFLRFILGQHLEVAPGRVTVTEQPNTKPRLKIRTGDEALGFNLSRSGAGVLVGVVRGRGIGVDLERVAPLTDLDSVAATVFSPCELASWSSLPTEHRLQAFYTAWTRKEAIGKAEGHGISKGPDTIAVPLEALPPGRWVGVAGSEPTSRWMMSGIAFVPDMIGCVAVQAHEGDHFTDSFEDVSIGGEDAAELKSLGVDPIQVPMYVDLVIRRFHSRNGDET